MELKGKQLKVFALWGLFITVINNLIGAVVLAIMGQGIEALFIILPLGLLVAGFAGYKTALALKNDSGYQRTNALTLAGVFTATFAGVFLSAANYLLTGQFQFGNLGVLIASAIGGYLVEKKITKPPADMGNR